MRKTTKAPLDLFVEQGSPVRSLQPGEAEKLLGKIDATLAMIHEQKDTLLGIEAETAKALTQRIASLTQERFAIERNRTGYSCLSLEPLGWLTDKKQPVFAVFSPLSAKFTLTVEYDRWETRIARKATWDVAKRAVPRPIVTAYKPALDVLAKDIGGYRHSKKSITTRFAGVIPAAQRQTIVEATSSFDQIVLIAEAAGWTEKTEQFPPMRDPLICGWADNNLWLLDRFDVTPIEDYIAQEFTV